VEGIHSANGAAARPARHENADKSGVALPCLVGIFGVFLRESTTSAKTEDDRFFYMVTDRNGTLVMLNIRDFLVDGPIFGYCVSEHYASG